MKGYILIFLVSVLMLVSYSCKDASANEIQVITASEMETQLKYDNVQVVDVRPESEYSESHLMRAKNIMYDDDFRENLKKLDKNKPVAIYCTSGSVSPRAAEILKEAGFTNIYVLDGGIKKWQGEKNNTEEN